MVEVILSSVETEHLMQGKILGNFLLGLIQLGVWVGIGLPAAWLVFQIPVFDYISVAQVPILLFFTLTGYLLFAAFFVGIGATAVDLQSMSNAQGMVIMLPILGFLFVVPVISNPDGLVAQVATLFPLTSALITILRLGLTTVPVWELVTAGAILLLTTVLVTRAAAKIFRVGMLMYGKSANLGEMWKWMRY
jgi:ABC-2 type transport system permease protein